jgi:Leucine-rich repeat (LRR) protein
MNRALLLLTLAVVVVCAPAGCAANYRAARAKAVAEIEKLGGRVVFDDESEMLSGKVLSYEERLDKPVVRVMLQGPKVTDASLEWLMGIPELEYLDLSGTQVTDTGLKRLQRLTRLRELQLNDTQVTDAGLEHLKSLMLLGSVELKNTKVTDAGVAALKKALQHGEPVYPDVRR